MSVCLFIYLSVYKCTEKDGKRYVKLLKITALLCRGDMVGTGKEEMKGNSTF
jgi:hypothetical protein